MSADSWIERQLRLANEQGLQGLRRGLAFALAGRDLGAPVMAETRDLVIPTADGPLAARLYRPAGAGSDRPPLLYFHGGGFVVCELETHDALCRRLAAAARLPVISSRYRLAPEAAFPAQVEDAESAARWLIASARDLGVAGERLVIGGDSAGAYLAASVAVRLNAEAPGRVIAQALIYPLLQMNDDAWASSIASDSRIVGRAAVAYIRAQLNAEGLDIPSLLERGVEQAPPTLILSGGMLDPCRPDALRYAELLREAGVKVVWREHAALPHGFANLTHVSPAARAAVAEFGGAIDRIVG